MLMCVSGIRDIPAAKPTRWAAGMSLGTEPLGKPGKASEGRSRASGNGIYDLGKGLRASPEEAG